MKRIAAIALLCVMLAGCSENPYRVDTVVRIPVNPTEAPTETAAPVTEAPTEIPETTIPATEPPETKPASGKSDQKESSKPKETKPETQPPTEPAFSPSNYSVGSLEKSVLKRMNASRTDAGLEELSISRKLSGIAALRAREAAQSWSHTRPDGRGYASAMSDYGYGYGASAESLACVSGSGDADTIMKKWMKTDTKNDILSESFTTAGIGVYRTGSMTYVCALLVG